MTKNLLYIAGICFLASSLFVGSCYKNRDSSEVSVPQSFPQSYSECRDKCNSIHLSQRENCMKIKNENIRVSCVNKSNLDVLDCYSDCSKFLKK